MNNHFIVSCIKSIIRIASCIITLVMGSIVPLAIGFIAAEVLGVLEEIVDKRR